MVIMKVSYSGSDIYEPRGGTHITNSQGESGQMYL